MKNIRVIVPVIICLALSFYIIGCGSVTGGGGGGGGGGGNTYIAADPYIVGAKFFIDYNSSESWNPGEPSSEAGSNDNGRFTLSPTPTMDGTMIISVKGKHNGVDYAADITRPFSTLESGDIVISPLTTLVTNGISLESIVYLLDNYAGITITTADVKADPMKGMDSLNRFGVTETALQKIRSTICIYAVMNIINSVEVGTGYKVTYEAMVAYHDYLEQMGELVRNGISTSELQNMGNSLEVSGLPRLTARDIAQSAVAVANHIVWQVQDTLPTPTFESNPLQYSIWGADLGIRFYCVNNKDNDYVKAALGLGPYAPQPGVSQIHNPFNGVTVEGGCLTAEAFKLNDNGTLEYVF